MTVAKAGKVAIVTGAARGIGAAVCRRLAANGWRIVACDQEAGQLALHAKSCEATLVTCDIATEAGVAAAVASARKEYGRIDAVISNAGISRNGPIATTTLSDWNAVLATNLTAAFLLAREAETDLRAVQGSIILIASTRAHMSEPGTLAYTASKGGLVALTHGLAVTLGPDVRVNCISPGWIDTGKWGPLKPEDHAQHPAGRVGTPGDVAGAVSYLLSEDARFMTGAELVLDGGMTRKMIYT
jgi:NAD(P)-dependent dehydrogenase (short-subunit alcohol dehydrogenase family)